MATSAWGRIKNDTISRVVAITPTVSPSIKFHNVPPSRSDSTGPQEGRSMRQFHTTTEPEEQLSFAGGGLRKARWTLSLVVSYPPSEDIDDLIGADHRDLMEALQPTSTYGTGSWGACCVRKVEEPDEPVRDGDLVEVRYPVAITFRQPVTMT